MDGEIGPQDEYGGPHNAQQLRSFPVRSRTEYKEMLTLWDLAKRTGPNRLREEDLLRGRQDPLYAFGRDLVFLLLSKKKLGAPSAVRKIVLRATGRPVEIEWL